MSKGIEGAKDIDYVVLYEWVGGVKDDKCRLIQRVDGEVITQVAFGDSWALVGGAYRLNLMAVGMIELARKAKDAIDLRDVQGPISTRNSGSYMTGLFNGLELIASAFEGKEPEYKEAQQPLDFEEYQKQAKTTAIYLNGFKERYPDLPEEVYEVLGLSYVGLGLGESGEVQGKIKKIIRDCAGSVDEERKSAIAAELGDILWYVAGACSELGISMTDVAQQNLDKLFSRKERGTLQGSGDNR